MTSSHPVRLHPEPTFYFRRYILSCVLNPLPPFVYCNWIITNKYHPHPAFDPYILTLGGILGSELSSLCGRSAFPRPNTLRTHGESISLCTRYNRSTHPTYHNLFSSLHARVHESLERKLVTLNIQPSFRWRERSGYRACVLRILIELLCLAWSGFEIRSQRDEYVAINEPASRAAYSY